MSPEEIMRSIYVSMTDDRFNTLYAYWGLDHETGTRNQLAVIEPDSRKHYEIHVKEVRH